MTNVTILSIGIIYLLVILMVGIWSGKRQKDMNTFYIGGRSFGPWLIALAISSTTMSGFGFIGLPGLAYENGYIVIMLGIFATAGIFVSFLILSKKMRKVSEKFDSMTISDMLETRYNSKAVRVVSAIAIFGGAIGYQMAQYKALGNMLQTVLGVDYQMALLIGVVILTVYVVAGGMISAIWTDFIQMMVMVVGSLIVFFGGLRLIGGFRQMNTELTAINPDLTQAFHTNGGSMTIFIFLSYFLLYMIGQQAQPHVVTKFYMIKKTSMLKKAAFIASLTYGITVLLWFSGPFSRILVERGEMPVPASADLVVPTFLTTFFHPVIAGLLFAAVMAAIMSTSEAFLLLASSAVVRDIYQQTIKKGAKIPAKTELSLSRWITLGTIVVTFLLSLNPPDLVGWLGNASWGIFVASLLPAVSIGIWWKRATKQAAFLSTTLGFLISLTLYVLKVKGIYIPQLDTGAIALIISTITFVGVSLVTKAEDSILFEEDSPQELSSIDHELAQKVK